MVYQLYVEEYDALLLFIFFLNSHGLDYMRPYFKYSITI